MEGGEENWIYPTSFNRCILKCSTSNGKDVTTLYMERNFDTLFVQLAFTPKVYQNDSVFLCDLLEPSDGGTPYLAIIDIIKFCGRSYNDQTYGVRWELAKQILQDPVFFDLHSPSNEYRLRSPIRFNIDQIDEVFSVVIPNYYGVTYGVRFTKDSLQNKNRDSRATDNSETIFICRKTKMPEVYEIFKDGLVPATPNNVLYIPNLSVAKEMKNVLFGRNSTKLKCCFDSLRQKWTPVV